MTVYDSYKLQIIIIQLQITVFHRKLLTAYQCAGQQQILILHQIHLNRPVFHRSLDTEILNA